MRIRILLVWSLEGIQESHPSSVDRGGGAASVDKGNLWGFECLELLESSQVSPFHLLGLCSPPPNIIIPM